MGYAQVKQRYAKALAKQVGRKERQKRDFFTRDEQRANNYYFDAYKAVLGLEEIPDGEPEGFVMKTSDELAPVNTGWKG